jgi:hypothetical protein
MMKKKKFKNTFRRWLWNFIKYQPTFFKNFLIRNMFQAPDVEKMNLIFKRAVTQDEIEQAARLLYSSYFEFGLVPENKTEKRLTKYHALPRTCLLIAKEGEKVIATISVIPDSAFGLPIESLWDISFLKNKSARVAEISCLAISRTFRHRRGEILFPLFRLLRDYSEIVLGIDHLVIATHPDVSDFYSSLLLFKPISSQPKIYEFVQGAPAYGQYANIGES